MQSNDTTRKRAPRRPPVERICEVCGGSFSALPSWIDAGRGRFCSTACFFTTRRTGEPRLCEYCGVGFYAKPDKIRRGAGRFCGVPCYDNWQRSSEPVETRLWLKVDRNGSVPPHRAEYGNCWIWTGYLVESGYGRLYRTFPNPVLTHRLSWEIATGDVLVTENVIGHVCDVRNCVRNDTVGTYTVDGVVLPRRGHLFRGTHTNNVKDTLEKGRHNFVLGAYVKHGEDHPDAILTEADVRSIRALYAAGGITQDALGKQFGIGQTVVSKVVLRKTWKHVD